MSNTLALELVSENRLIEELVEIGFEFNECSLRERGAGRGAGFREFREARGINFVKNNFTDGPPSNTIVGRTRANRTATLLYVRPYMDTTITFASRKNALNPRINVNADSVAMSQ
jgi:hypothetical protein